jgi:dTDP-4-dehydrorhamnose reductase
VWLGLQGWGLSRRSAVPVLITGAEGQLGLDLLDAFEEAVGVAHRDLDVADEGAVFDAVTRIAPDLVVNAAAWTDVDGCESDPGRAHEVNALGPWWLARACREVGAALLTVSTDYVFDGERPAHAARGHSEFDPTVPASEYGRSKLAGEWLVRQTLREHYIVRTAWLAGARGSNFVRTMLRVGRERGAARVVDDQMGSPTFTRDLAPAIREIAASRRYGTYHRTNSGRCSWYDLARETFDLAGLDVDLQRMTSDELVRPAPRPAFSVLSNLHAERAGLRVFRPWQDGLRDLLFELGEDVSSGREGREPKGAA